MPGNPPTDPGGPLGPAPALVQYQTNSSRLGTGRSETVRYGASRTGDRKHEGNDKAAADSTANDINNSEPIPNADALEPSGQPPGLLGRSPVETARTRTGKRKRCLTNNRLGGRSIGLQALRRNGGLACSDCFEATELENENANIDPVDLGTQVVSVLGLRTWKEPGIPRRSAVRPVVRPNRSPDQPGQNWPRSASGAGFARAEALYPSSSRFFEPTRQGPNRAAQGVFE